MTGPIVSLTGIDDFLIAGNEDKVKVSKEQIKL